MISDKRQATLDTRHEYWEGLLDYAFRNPEFAGIFKKGKATDKNWLDFNLKGTGCHIAAMVNVRKNELRAELYIFNKQKLYLSLLNKRETLEAEAGLTFDWHESGGKANTIRVWNNWANLSDRSEWPKQFEWLTDVILRIRNTFIKYL